MSNGIKVILLYENKEKQIKVPESFEDFEKVFYKEFNENKNKQFGYYYLDSDDEENNFDNESEYVQALDEFKKKKKYEN